MTHEVNLLLVAPEIFLGSAAMILLVLGVFLKPEREGPVLHAASLAVLAVTAALCMGISGQTGRAFSGMVIADNLRQFLNLILIGATFMTVLLSGRYAHDMGIGRAEYYALILLSLFGMMLITGAGDLVMVFVGIETMSIPVYVLVGLRRTDAAALEASMKYFLFGAFATGFLLYGMALAYGVFGTTDLVEIAAKGAADRALYDSPVFPAAVAMLLVGLGFKVAAVPFHAWTPDVYEGAPTTVTGFMAAAVKTAAFAAVIRVLLEAFGPAHAVWEKLVYALAVLSMVGGNVAAVVQQNVKRMLAYSSIAHAGYLLVGVTVTGGLAAVPAILFYLLVYGLMTLGAFGVVVALEREGREASSFDDYAGLGFRRPMLGLAMGACMFSLAGIPPLADFFGKFYLFGQAISRGYYALAVVGVLASVVSVYYYLRLPVVMYMRPSAEGAPAVEASASERLVLAGAVLALIVLGIVPAYVMNLATATLATAAAAFH